MSSKRSKSTSLNNNDMTMPLSLSADDYEFQQHNDTNNNHRGVRRWSASSSSSTTIQNGRGGVVVHGREGRRIVNEEAVTDSASMLLLRSSSTIVAHSSTWSNKGRCNLSMEDTSTAGSASNSRKDPKRRKIATTTAAAVAAESSTLQQCAVVNANRTKTTLKNSSYITPVEQRPNHQVADATAPATTSLLKRERADTIGSCRVEEEEEEEDDRSRRRHVGIEIGCRNIRGMLKQSPRKKARRTTVPRISGGDNEDCRLGHNNSQEKNNNSIVHFQVTDEAPILALIEGISSVERPMRTAMVTTTTTTTQGRGRGLDQADSRGVSAPSTCGLSSSSSSPKTALNEYRTCLARNLQPQDCPRSGRMIELPSEAMLGLWTAEMTKVDEDDNNDDNDDDREFYRQHGNDQQQVMLQRRVASSREQSEDPLPSAVLKEILKGGQSAGDVLLGGYRMLLRHESYSTMGPLWVDQEMLVDGVPSDNTVNIDDKESQDGYMSDHPQFRSRGGGNHGGNEKVGSSIYESLVLTTLYPLKNRGSEIGSQNAGLLSSTSDIGSSNSVSHYNETFIGSLSCVGVRGFHSVDEMNAQALDVTANVLKNVNIGTRDSFGLDGGGSGGGDNAAADRLDGIRFPSLCEVIDGDQGLWSQSHSSIGASLLCGLPLDSDYRVIIAQDQNQINNHIVAVDSK
jgi:hypothetical protein